MVPVRSETDGQAARFFLYGQRCRIRSYLPDLQVSAGSWVPDGKECPVRTPQEIRLTAESPTAESPQSSDLMAFQILVADPANPNLSSLFGADRIVPKIGANSIVRGAFPAGFIRQ